MFQQDTFTPLNCEPIGKVNLDFGCFQRDVCVHACVCGVMFGLDSGFALYRTSDIAL